MQAIARATRVFEDNPLGLVVDHIGLDADLKRDLARRESTIELIGSEEPHVIAFDFVKAVRSSSF